MERTPVESSPRAGRTGSTALPRRLGVLRAGVVLLRVFWWTTLAATIGLIAAAFVMFPAHWVAWVAALACVAALETLVFWIGIVAVYLTSVQLGLRIRVIGVVCGWIPVLNLVALRLIIRTCREEVRFESDKERLDASRSAERVCATRYPILLVHGVFFRDSKVINYWGRIPGELERNGATVYYGDHQSAASVADAGRELAARIRAIVEETGCGKVNVIAHSKGGLDMRWAIAREGIGGLVASLTTINTPHRGCGFADYLLAKVPAGARLRIEAAYNTAAARLGDPDPDFMAAVQDLTQAGCARLNRQIGFDSFPGIVCRSVGSRLLHATTGRFPLNFTYSLVKWFDGPNDGLVSQTSFPWGDDFTWLEPSGSRGISHADMIDLNRENIPGFDVREFYVGLVADLKRRGL
ncbi:esterase/lipase family protein [Bifidobacterium avesanii]|uniref:esterase/lipase family protein n=1 Tax=Bifidobacterium avesanii TaxID=1798157 RepID=UPI001385316B|nr:triacylglycerol lipase [Bifidobacterium avesanii]KAB8288886.1 triacylglycerol lipase [Bifidobacterium avesanii]